MTGETVVRLRASTSEDIYGSEVRDWAGADAAPITGCVVAPRLDGEAHADGRQGVIVGFTVYAPPGTEVLPSDRLTIRGRDHEVDGEPGDWVDPWSGVSKGVELAARRVDG